MTTPTQFEELTLEQIRADFPILQRESSPGTPLAYLDSAATSQKPHQVIEAISQFYSFHNANIHRGIHRLAEEATEAYEGARRKIADFIGVSNPRQVILTRNTTEAINLVAYSWGRSELAPGDLILASEMEHHSNLVPWQMLAAERDLRLEFIPVTDDLILDLEAYRQLLAEQPKLVTFTHMSNVLGTINPAEELTRLAQAQGALVLIDGAQSVPHFHVDVEAIGADFYAFSAHKMCGPSGVGVLYGKKQHLESMPPFLGGGDMIKRVALRHSTYQEIPHKFEAGTPAIAEVVGFGAAVDYLTRIGMDEIMAHEQHLLQHAVQRLEEVPGVRVYSPSGSEKGGVASFSLDVAHPHDIAQILDREGVAVRAGHHCAMPLHEKLELPASTRASFYLYNTVEEIDRLIKGIYKVKELFG